MRTSRASGVMTGARIGVGLVRISVGVKTARRRPLLPLKGLVPALRINSARPRLQSNGPSNARIAAPGQRVSSSISSAIKAITRVAVIGHGAPGRRVRIASACRPCRARIAPLRSLPR